MSDEDRKQKALRSIFNIILPCDVGKYTTDLNGCVNWVDNAWSLDLSCKSNLQELRFQLAITYDMESEEKTVVNFNYGDCFECEWTQTFKEIWDLSRSLPQIGDVDMYNRPKYIEGKIYLTKLVDTNSYSIRKHLYKYDDEHVEKYAEFVKPHVSADTARKLFRCFIGSISEHIRYLHGRVNWIHSLGMERGSLIFDISCRCPDMRIELKIDYNLESAEDTRVYFNYDDLVFVCYADDFVYLWKLIQELPQVGDVDKISIEFIQKMVDDTSSSLWKQLRERDRVYYYTCSCNCHDY